MNPSRKERRADQQRARRARQQLVEDFPLGAALARAAPITPEDRQLTRLTILDAVLHRRRQLFAQDLRAAWSHVPNITLRDEDKDEPRITELLSGDDDAPAPSLPAPPLAESAGAAACDDVWEAILFKAIIAGNVSTVVRVANVDLARCRVALQMVCTHFGGKGWTATMKRSFVVAKLNRQVVAVGFKWSGISVPAILGTASQAPTCPSHCWLTCVPPLVGRQTRSTPQRIANGAIVWRPHHQRHHAMGSHLQTVPRPLGGWARLLGRCVPQNCTAHHLHMRV